jgi:hypothetical protein
VRQLSSRRCAGTLRLARLYALHPSHCRHHETAAGARLADIELLTAPGQLE